MRPKVVLFTLLAAFAALGVIALFKGTAAKSPNRGGDQIPAAQAAADAGSVSDTNEQISSAGHAGPAAPASPEIHAAVVTKEIDDIQNALALANSDNAAETISGFIDKLSHPEAEVRQAALDALKQLNDTNAISGLQKVADKTSDAREKVAILDVIDYLRLPTFTENVPVTTNTLTGADNQAAPPVRHHGPSHNAQDAGQTMDQSQAPQPQ